VLERRIGFQQPRPLSALRIKPRATNPTRFAFFAQINSLAHHPLRDGDDDEEECLAPKYLEEFAAANTLESPFPTLSHSDNTQRFGALWTDGPVSPLLARVHKPQAPRMAALECLKHAPSAPNFLG
jgi:hypothetical protein